MTHYVCPDCKEPTSKMTLIEGKSRRPTEFDLKERPGMSHISHEVLRCPCGKINTWYTVIEKNGPSI